jgi:hypothetical protein
VTHLRKMMLEELQRRHYSHRTAKAYLASSAILRSIFIVHRTSLVRNRFVSTRLIYFKPRSSPQLRCPSTPRRSVSSS